MPTNKFTEKKKSFHWLVDLEKENRETPPTKIEVKEEGVELRLERISFGQYAAVHMTYVSCAEPFRIAPTHEASQNSSPTISFQIALSGSSRGSLPQIGEFELDRTWGFLTDFAEGEAEIIVAPGEPLRSFGGTLSLKQIEVLFADEHRGFTLASGNAKQGVIEPFLVTPVMRGIITDALATPLIGPLRHLYLEGVVLQIFALIFQSQLNQSIVYEENETTISAGRCVIELAAKLLVQDLANPPNLLGLSEATGLSVRKISEGFKRVFDSTVVDYLVSKRMESACDLIREKPDYPIKALSADIGYNHVSNFTRAFKQKFGTTPAAYAKAFRGNLDASSSR